MSPTSKNRKRALKLAHRAQVARDAARRAPHELTWIERYEAEREPEHSHAVR